MVDTEAKTTPEIEGEYQFSKSDGVDAIADAFKQTKLDQAWWEKLKQRYITAGYHLSENPFYQYRGFFFEIHVQEVLENLARSTGTVDPFPPELSTPTYNFVHPNRRGVGMKAWTKAKTTEAEFDSLVIVSGKDGKRMLVGVEAKMVKSRKNHKGRVSGGVYKFLNADNLKRYSDVLSEYVGEYNRRNPKRKLDGYACVLVVTQEEAELMKNQSRKVLFEKRKGVMVGAPFTHGEFTRKANMLGLKLRADYVARQSRRG